MKAIETKYKGYRFRSRLEARWAVFFDEIGVKWEYEPAGFDTRIGPYLPDFYLPIVGGGTWVEIKSEHIDKSDREAAGLKIGDVVHKTMKRGIIFMGDPLSNVLCDDNDPPGNSDGSASWMIFPEGADGPYLFCICPWTGEAGIEFDGRGSRVSEHLELTDEQKTRISNGVVVDSKNFYDNLNHGDKAYSSKHPKLISAASIARSSRFEHDERK